MDKHRNNVVPIGGHDPRPTIDVDRLERERARAGRRPLEEAPLTEAELDGMLRRSAAPIRKLDPPPGLAAAVVDELELRHRRAYHRRQEARARAVRRRDVLARARAVAFLTIAAVIALAALVVIFAPAR